MRKFKKLLAVILSAFMALSCGLFLTGCSDECEHDGNITCSLCGEVVLGDDFFVNYVDSQLQDFGLGKGVSVDVNASAELNSTQETPQNRYYYDVALGQEVSQPLSKMTVSIEGEDIIVGVDQYGILYADGAIDVAISEFDMEGEIFYKASATITDFAIRGELITGILVDKTEYVGLSTENRAENDEQNETAIEFALSSIEEISEYVPTVVYGVLPMVLEVYEQAILPYVQNNILTVNKKDINDTLAHAIDAMYKVKKVNSGYEFTMDGLGDSIIAIENALDMTILELVDSIIGDGQYEKLPDKVTEILGMTIEEVLAEVAKKGITVDNLIELGDKIAKIITDDDTMTLNAFIQMVTESETPIDIKAMIEEYKTLTVKTILKGVLGVEDADIDQGILDIAAALNTYKDVTIYQLLEVDEQTKTLIGTIVAKVAPALDEIILSKINTDAKGNLISAEFGLVYDYDNLATKSLINWLAETDVESNYTFLQNADLSISIKVSPVKVENNDVIPE
ncbi:MAG: hypothetical protein II988_00960 [Clostridia bacterium]|nr:hypothetical protein [Clostridia bacterium]